MKKFTLLLLTMLAYAGVTMAQVIDDFEPIKMNLFDQGANGSLSVVPNPDPTGANTSAYVAKMVRGADGKPWAGWYATIAPKIDITANRYLHLKVWKPRVSPTCFKVEGGAGNSGDTYPLTDYTNVGHWEELVYDWTTSPGEGNPVVKPSGEYEKIVLIPDFLTPVGLTEDITLYFDDMYVNNDPVVGSAPVQVIENFETITMNIMLNGADDLSAFSLIPNPDKSGINLSDYVVKLHRDKDGVPWCGFWGPMNPSVDVTTNKYVHAKVWKPRLSGVKFKLEGGPSGTSERGSKYPQTKIGQWEDIVWDYSDFTGAYPIIAFLPDFADPVGLTEDIDLYFDDIRVNNDPNPMTPPKQVFQVDLNGAKPGFDPATMQVYIAGTLGGKYGTWNRPSTNANNQMFDHDGDGIYTIDLQIPDGIIAFKFFYGGPDWGDGWGTGDPFSGGDRTYTVSGAFNNIYTWGVGGFETAVRENKLAGKIQMYPNPVRNELTIDAASTVISKVIITNALGKVVGNHTYTTNKTINTTNLSKGMYFVTFVGADGNKVTQKLIKD